MSPLPTRLYGNVSVPDTPLITAALSFSKAHSTPTLHNHMIRSWLFGFILASKAPALTTRDQELHSLAAILHDVGLDPNPTSSLVSTDKCFEVDSANAALAFLSQASEADEKEWDTNRKQLLWDAIALHAVPHIALHKQPEVVATCLGIALDFGGPEGPFSEGLMTWGEYEGVVRDVPRLGMKTEFVEVMCGICRRKPAACVGSVAEKWGEKYVEGFPPEGMRIFEVLERGLEMLG
ncbi:MAG: hypothetical protein Q9204_000947 [Flavoplaca sp. TL-2023a]